MQFYKDEQGKVISFDDATWKRIKRLHPAWKEYIPIPDEEEPKKDAFGTSGGTVNELEVLKKEKTNNANTGVKPKRKTSPRKGQGSKS